MCPWEDIVKELIGDDPSAVCELLARDECLLTAVKMRLRGRQKEPAEIAQKVYAKLLVRWVNIRGAVIRAAAGQQLAAHVPLFRNQINWLIKTALGDDKRIGSPLTGTNDEGKEFGIDPVAPDDNAIEVKETAEVIWKRVARINNIRSRVFCKLRGIIGNATHSMAEAELADAEREWRPDPALYPNSRSAGEVADALVRCLRQNPNLAAPNDWLAQEFRLAPSKNPRNLIDQWVSRAGHDLDEALLGDRDDLQ